MKKNSFFGLILLVSFVAFSCNDSGQEEKNIVTKRIQYDVSLRSPEPDMDWWVQNIEGKDREKLLQDIISNVSDGKVKAYDFLSYKLYSTDEIKQMLKRVDTISVEKSTPPYDLVDTLLITEIRLRDITKLRFLEEWRMNNKTLEFNKKVLGICPMVEKLTDSGEIRGYKPLFWVFFDEAYPKELENK